MKSTIYYKNKKKFNAFQTKCVFPNFKIPSENLTSLRKIHDFRQKVNIMTARLQEARVIPSKYKYNRVVVVEITHILSRVFH